MGYSPWGHKESDMAERLSIHSTSHSAIRKIVRALLRILLLGNLQSATRPRRWSLTFYLHVDFISSLSSVQSSCSVVSDSL